MGDSPRAKLRDLAPETHEMRDEVLAGLREAEKQIPSKYLYDETGSALFDKICELDEYYLTRTELAIMREHVGDMADALGPRCLLIEYGTGLGIKTELLLEHLHEPAGFVPIDISREALVGAVDRLRERYPELPIFPVCADYTQVHDVSEALAGERHRAIYFPGSTIGNFTPAEATLFLDRVRQTCGEGGGLLIGVDLVKDVRRLLDAYDDAAGVSAAFALNVLGRLNREVGADFAPDRFRYEASWDAARARIEMALVSRHDQTVRIGSDRIALVAGERIRTEYSYKYTLESFGQLAGRSGFEVTRVWTDPERLFSVQLLRAL